MKAIEVVYEKYNKSLTNVTDFYRYFNPIRPDPFEFLIGLSVCLWDTHSLKTIWNELEGCNFACRFDFTHFEDPSIQIWKVDPFRVMGRGY